MRQMPENQAGTVVMKFSISLCRSVSTGKRWILK
ncbi:unnamed protein product [Arabidopsis halleri]